MEKVVRYQKWLLILFFIVMVNLLTIFMLLILSIEKILSILAYLYLLIFIALLWFSVYIAYKRALKRYLMDYLKELNCELSPIYKENLYKESVKLFKTSDIVELSSKVIKTQNMKMIYAFAGKSSFPLV